MKNIKKIKLQGFTLIELLVTVAIIAILASLLLPALSRARQKAQQAKCISNLKNLSMSVHHYSIDYHERFPIQGTGASGKESLALLYILDYIPTQRLFICPNGNGTNALNGDYRYAPTLRETSESDSPIICDDSIDHHQAPHSVNVVNVGGDVQMRVSLPNGVSAPIE
ncbi:MAG: prepilin-type N-terminal cleavage/methylation domain-containing protein [Chlamydiota bacterium]|nr:prepilin-type N-terminal cleavage/methylation domain-containing protein [Chlamydiota bacterium]